MSLLLSLAVISSLFYLLKVINQQKELAEIKNDLISNITHEFKTPITTISAAIEAIDTLAERYLSRNKNMHLKHLNKECKELLHKADKLVELNIIEDPDYHIVSDKLA